MINLLNLEPSGIPFFFTATSISNLSISSLTPVANLNRSDQMQKLHQHRLINFFMMFNFTFFGDKTVSNYVQITNIVKVDTPLNVRKIFEGISYRLMLTFFIHSIFIEDSNSYCSILLIIAISFLLSFLYNF